MADMTSPLDRVRAIMARLRHPDHGCEWDQAQTHRSIAHYAVEEAHELAEAIELADPAAIRDELGDLLLQVVFHARIAEESGHFDLDDVATALADKLERRHPHLFGEADGDRADRRQWDRIKREERAAKGQDSAMDGVARTLPALTRADKLQRRAAALGFDWPDATGPLAKIHEELAEVAAAVDEAARIDEVGDFLFAAVNYARHLGVDPESALRGATAKFERRFRHVEAHGPLADQSLEARDALWEAAKRSS